MRISLELRTGEFPLIFRNRIMALIKQSLLNSDPNFKEAFFDHNRNPKPFTFYIEFPSNKKYNPHSHLILKDNVKINTPSFSFDDQYPILHISSSNFYFIYKLLEGFEQMGEFSFSNDIAYFFLNGERINIKLGKVSLYEDLDFENKKTYEFRIMSPVVIFQGIKNKLDVNELLEVQSYKKRKILGEPIKDLDIKFENVKRKLIKHTFNKYRIKNKKPYFLIEGYEGEVHIKGHKEDIKFIFDAGLGLSSSQGFGYLDLKK